jgi:hypothetical protein
MPRDPKPVQGLLRGAALASIMAQLDSQGRLLRAVREGLPAFLSIHCRHCIAKGDRLLIYADSPAFASQVRFYGPGLLPRIEQSIGLRFRDIQVRNLLDAAPMDAINKKPRAVPPARGVSELLRESAENAAHEEITEALLRLSRTLAKGRNGKDSP